MAPVLLMLLIALTLASVTAEHGANPVIRELVLPAHHLVEPTPPPPPPLWVWPLQGNITQGFGCTGFSMEQWNGRCHFHGGLDISTSAQDPVVAAHAGQVTSGWDPRGYGLFVEETVGDGLTLLYGHLSSVIVSQGQDVAVGQQIGNEGTTGTSTGDHLHFAVWNGSAWLDPHTVLP